MTLTFMVFFFTVHDYKYASVSLLKIIYESLSGDQTSKQTGAD